MLYLFLPNMHMKKKSKESVANTEGRQTLNFPRIRANIKENPSPTNPIINPQIAPKNKTIINVLKVIGISTLGVYFVYLVTRLFFSYLTTKGVSLVSGLENDIRYYKSNTRV